MIFSVDIFNEGLNMPAIDLVMFLRPTKSTTIFLQQSGRRLRKHKDKKYLNVLDFIGNYKKADLFPFLLSGKTYSRIEANKGIFKEEKYPEDCRVDFDFRIIDVFRKLADKEMNVKDHIKEEFLRVKELVGHRPSRVEFFNNIDGEVYTAIKKCCNLDEFIYCLPKFLANISKYLRDAEKNKLKKQEFINFAFDLLWEGISDTRNSLTHANYTINGHECPEEEKA